MNSADRELEMRHRLKRMFDPSFWELTWHEDRQVSPGVPDASYVLKPHSHMVYQTGWLELKSEAAFDKKGTVKFKLQPAQHDWIERHQRLIPVDILVEVGEIWYFVAPGVHLLLGAGIAEDTLKNASVTFGHRDTMKHPLSAALAIRTRIK